MSTNWTMDSGTMMSWVIMFDANTNNYNSKANPSGYGTSCENLLIQIQIQKCEKYKYNIYNEKIYKYKANPLA